MCCTGTPQLIVTNGRVQLIANPCEQITLDSLVLYKSQVDCVIAKGAYTAASTSELECSKAQDILVKWIAIKQVNYAACDYKEVLPVMQDLVRRIILSNVCQ